MVTESLWHEGSCEDRDLFFMRLYECCLPRWLMLLSLPASSAECLFTGIRPYCVLPLSQVL